MNHHVIYNSHTFIICFKHLFKVCLLFLAMQQHALAGAVFDETLSFGKFSITNNASVSSLTVTRHGQAFSTNNIRIISPGEPAQVKFFSYPPFTTLYLSPITPVSGQVQSGISAEFNLVQLDMPSSITTNAIGEASFNIGGTIESSGTSQNYLDSTFIFNLSFTVNY